MKPFGPLLADYLTQRGWSIRAFARQVDHNPTFISQIIRGQRRPPLKRVDAWADQLDLSSQDRESFLDAAALAHAPARVHEIIARYRSDSEQPPR